MIQLIGNIQNKQIYRNNKLVVASGWERGRMGVTTNGYEVSFGGDKMF